MDRARVLDAVLRNDLLAFTQKSFGTLLPGDEFIPGRHLEAIAWHLTCCLNGRIKRLIITMPPRNLKSICTSVAFPAFVLGRNPTRRLICVSYADDLARKHSRDCRQVMESAWYRRTFPGARLSLKKNTETEIVTAGGGFRYATSIGGTLTGLGGNFLIVDDPIKSGAAMSQVERKRVIDFYDNTLYSRLDSKANDVIIIVTQRTHVEDLVGHVLGNDEWVHLNLPAIADADQRIAIGDKISCMRRAGSPLHALREPMEVLLKTKTITPEPVWEAQYQQNPAPPGGYQIRRDWFPRYDGGLQRKDFHHVALSVDVALSTGGAADYSVIMVFGICSNGKAYLWEVIRQRLEYTALKDLIVKTHFRYQANSLVIEMAPISMGLIQQLRPDQQPLGLFCILPRGDKESRVADASFTMKHRKIVLPDETPWLSAFEEEIFTFPYGHHDDQVDALSQFIRFWTRPDGRRQIYGT